MSDESVEQISLLSALSAKRADLSGKTVNSMCNFEKSDVAEEHATRLAELQGQVSFFTDL